MNTEPLIVKWNEGPQNDRITWFLRSVSTSGDFFGEITHFSNRLQRTLSGKILESDFQRLSSLVQEIRRYYLETDGETPKAGWHGLLAVGTLANPKILLHYYPGEETSEPGRSFLKIIGILRPYVESEFNPLPRTVR